MNIFSVIGLVFAIAVLVIGLRLSSDDLSIFLDYPSMFIVIGGTLAATAISFQVDRVGILLKVFFRRIVQGKKYNYQKIIAELISISENYRKGESLESLSSKAKDEFLKESLQLASENVVKGEELHALLTKRIKNLHFHYTEEANKFKSLSKFPPAFGMMGTTIGMIVLLANLGGKDALKMIGPAMGVCLITTLYGVIIANLGVIPVAENLQESNREVFLKNKIVVDGVRLILEKKNPILVAEELNSFLPPSKRLDWKTVLNK